MGFVKWKSLVTVKSTASLDWRGGKVDRKWEVRTWRWQVRTNSFENFAIEGSRDMGQYLEEM